ncbi:hypothetical protein WMO13_02620 [Ignatzschineria larvae DSM 13226]|uniref:Uncharacterized protein n=1 Tax=Ignatzschineria larvae DSM 13226 TaxID=1111732 RepID=A0ABZ3C2K6_9GAMM|nr:hypothetical protein [Ignatzschineria larvae]
MPFIAFLIVVYIGYRIIRPFLNRAETPLTKGFSRVKSTILRLIDHGKGFACGVLAEIFTNIIPPKLLVGSGFTLFSTYLGFVMMFPARPNRFATGVGIIATIITALSGAWPVSLLVGGLFTAVVGIRDRHIGNRIFWLTIPLAILFLYGALQDNHLPLLSLFPLWALIAFAILLAFGILAPEDIRRKFGSYFMNKEEREAYLEEEQRIAEEAKILQQQAEQRAMEEQILRQQNAKYELVRRHIEVLTVIEQENLDMPGSIKQHVDQIIIYTRQMVDAIEKDERNVLSAGRFLNTFLPSVQMQLQMYLKIYRQDMNAVRDMHVQVMDSMRNFRKAFKEEAGRLVETDLSVLQTELNLGNTLMRSKGYATDSDYSLTRERPSNQNHTANTRQISVNSSDIEAQEQLLQESDALEHQIRVANQLLKSQGFKGK